MDALTKMVLDMLKMTKACFDPERSYLARAEIVFAMSGRDVVLLVDCYEHSRMTITGDALGNGMNRSDCEKALFKSYMGAR